MKIVFLCSSMEPGGDGVGDYTRRLAGKLIQMGHQAIVIAISDRHIKEYAEAIQYVEEIALEVYRFPVTQDSKQRFEMIAACKNNFNPDVVSIQYVGFGFHRRGLPMEMLFNLKPVIGKSKLHIMFHELWCGMAVTAGKKEKILGFLQKNFLKLLVKVLKPDEIFTSIQPYVRFLEQVGISAKLVPIFGNIELDDLGDDQEWSELVNSTNLDQLINASEDWLVLGFFGTVYMCVGLEQLIQSASDAAVKLGKKLGILSIGHNRGLDIKIIGQNINGITYWKAGMLNAGMINRAIKLINMGVVTSPVDGLNKSGAAVAWLERGIPILISGSDLEYERAQMEFIGVYQIKEDSDVLRVFKNKINIPPNSRLNEAVKAYETLNNV